MRSAWLRARTAIAFLPILALAPISASAAAKKPPQAKARHAAPAKSAKGKAKPTGRPAKGKPVKGKPAKAARGKAVNSRQRAGRESPANAPTAQSIRLTSAFLASSQLRPMAQQLASTRSSAAYDGVFSYAKGHPGDGAATAYLALGHAYMLDKRYPEALSTYKQAAASGDALSDYADYLGAQAALAANRGADAYSLLDRFDERHPGSIFIANAPVLLANLYLQQNNPKGALGVLAPFDAAAQSTHSDFRYALARAYQMTGDTGHAAPIFRDIFLKQPLTGEATQSRAQLQAMNVPAHRSRAQDPRRRPLQRQALLRSQPGISHPREERPGTQPGRS